MAQYQQSNVPFPLSPDENIQYEAPAVHGTKLDASYERAEQRSSEILVAQALAIAEQIARWAIRAPDGSNENQSTCNESASTKTISLKHGKTAVRESRRRGRTVTCVPCPSWTVMLLYLAIPVEHASSFQFLRKMHSVWRGIGFHLRAEGNWLQFQAVQYENSDDKPTKERANNEGNSSLPW